MGAPTNLEGPAVTTNLYRSRPPPGMLVGLLMMCIALFVSSTMASCTKSKRSDTIRASLIAVNAVRDGFVAWDHAQQALLVDHAASKEEARAALNAYRDKRSDIVTGFEVAYRALAVAATQNDEVSLKAALAESAELINEVRILIGGA